MNRLQLPKWHNKLPLFKIVPHSKVQASKNKKNDFERKQKTERKNLLREFFNI
jgi:hypothetical protein